MLKIYLNNQLPSICLKAGPSQRILALFICFFAKMEGKIENVFLSCNLSAHRNYTIPRTQGCVSEVKLASSFVCSKGNLDILFLSSMELVNKFCSISSRKLQSSAQCPRCMFFNFNFVAPGPFIHSNQTGKRMRREGEDMH